MHLQYSGLIPVFGGVYSLLMAYRIIPRKPKDPERMELWHRKFGTMMKVLGPMLIGFGLLELCGVIDDANPATQDAPYAREFAAAVRQWENDPPGQERVERFIQNLKKLEARPDLPAEFKQALEDYTDAMQTGLVALKEGRDIAPYDQKAADAKKRMQAFLKK